MGVTSFIGIACNFQNPTTSISYLACDEEVIFFPPMSSSGTMEQASAGVETFCHEEYRRISNSKVAIGWRNLTRKKKLEGEFNFRGGGQCGIYLRLKILISNT